MLSIDVKCQLTVAMHNFAAMWADSFAVIDLFGFGQMNIFDVTSDIELCVGGIVALVALIVFDFGMHSANVEGDLAFFGELFAADGTLFAEDKNT